MTLMSFTPDTPTTTKRYLTAVELAEQLGVNYATIGRWRSQGLPTHQVVKRGVRLFVLAEVQAWIESRCIEPAPGQDVA
jgi:predicted DNA-binding transcriptional regulator AlpA